MKEELVLTIKKFVYYYFDVFDYRGKKAIESVFEITKNEDQIKHAHDKSTLLTSQHELRLDNERPRPPIPET